MEGLVTKESKENHNALLNRFNVFSEIESVGKLEHYYLPKLQEFMNQIAGLHESNAEVRESIIKFDELLSLKCNKSALMAFQHSLALDFMKVTEWDTIDLKIDNVKDMN